MATYQVRHLNTGETNTRPWIFFNPNAQTWNRPQEKTDPSVELFHKSLPSYNETPLHTLPSLASTLHLPHLFLKDESTRFGLPAFKILGASYAVHRTICAHFNLPSTTPLGDLKQAISESPKEVPKLVTCSEGNWGRAVARMAKVLNVPVSIYVPWFMAKDTCGLIRGEGAEIVVLGREKGSYDDSIAAVREDAEKTGALMVMDVAWEGYEGIPRWVTSGYTTMLTETDRQISSLTNNTVEPNTFFISIGVGSWAHSVVAHYKSLNPSNRIIAVEPHSAASLKESLHCDEITPIETGETIMAGMNCGTISTLAWPVLQHGIHAATTVTDYEAHQAVEELRAQGVSAGPCGAATLAALKKYREQVSEEERNKMVVVLFSTEGAREYEVPVSVQEQKKSC